MTCSFLFAFKNHLLVCLLVLLTVSPFNAGWAKTAPISKGKNISQPDITGDTIQSKIEAINVRKGLDEALKSKVLSIYQSAQDNLNNIDNFKNRINELNQAIKQTPDLLKLRQKDIEQTLAKLAKQKPEDFSKIPTDELDQREIIEKGKISTLDEQLKKIENERLFQQNRPQLIREEILTASQDIEASQKKLEVSANKALSKLEIEAQLVYLKTLINARSSELKMLEIEAFSNPARVELLKAEFKLLDIQKNELSPIITAIDTSLADRRETEAKHMQDALNLAEKELSGKHPLIQTIARENIQYTRDIQAINVKIEDYTNQKAKVDTESNEINDDFKSAEKKIHLAGLSPELGKILREQRRNLSNEDSLTLQTETIQNETAINSLAEFKVEDKLKKISEIDVYLQQLMLTQVDTKLPLETRMMIQAELRVLLNNQKELLNKLAFDYTTFLRVLGDFDFAKQKMLTQANKFAIYLDEHLFWVKSSDPIDLDTPLNLLVSAEWLLSPFNWFDVIKDSARIASEHPFVIFLGTLAFIVFLGRAPWFKHELTIIATNAEKKYTEHFKYTLQAIFYTGLLTLRIPLIIFILGWLLSRNLHHAEFTKAIGEGLKTAAFPLMFLQFFYCLFTTDGIVRKHFQWKKTNVSLLHQQIKWLRYVAVITAFIISSTYTVKNSLYGDNLGRLSFILSMIAMSIFWGRVLHPEHGLMHTPVNNHPEGWAAKCRYIWYPALYIIPLAIIIFAIMGYYLSALQLQGQLVSSMRIIFLAVISHEMVVRCLTLINRQLAIKNAQQKRQATALTEKHPLFANEEAVLINNEALIDIPKINAQTTRLLNVFICLGIVIGFWMTWKNILPAFSFLDNIVLWQHLVIADDQQSYQPITLSHLLLACLYFFIVVVSVRNFSGVMEILIFRRLSIEAGSRYAVNQLSNYLIMSIGFISIANELGGSWSQVQWLVAALSVGLGFGLQEIFANLVSGIIILFERPIRVHDTVTIGDITGNVTRIQMRATTLIDADQKEHVVPNKTFITSQLVNWSLSDPITRVVVPVSIAYGTDVEFVHKLLLETAWSTPLVLHHPEPTVFFVGFGDNALLFSIRVFVSDVINRYPVTHNLHVRLEEALRVNKIEIPFPQQDVHIRTTPNRS